MRLSPTLALHSAPSYRPRRPRGLQGAVFKVTRTFKPTRLDKALALRGAAHRSARHTVVTHQDLLYATELFGPSPTTPDPVAKYWGEPANDTPPSSSSGLGWRSSHWADGLKLFALTTLAARTPSAC